MLVCANGGTSLDETHVFVREGASIAPAALAQKIEDCCFAYDEDCISDSWRTQQRDFERDARKFANELLLGADEALAENIRAVFTSAETGMDVPSSYDRKVQIGRAHV